MKVLAATLLLGAASATVSPQQQVLKLNDQIVQAAEKASNVVSSSGWAKPLKQLEESLKGLTTEAQQLWDEVTLMFPEAMDKANFFSMPKPHVRRHDSEWDHIVSGAEIQSLWTEDALGEKHREIDGNLENYSMRVKKVDPSVLGVDKVKQYSGYLDDAEDDKHLFYCKLRSKPKRVYQY